MLPELTGYLQAIDLTISWRDFTPSNRKGLADSKTPHLLTLASKNRILLYLFMK
jgi:hypothetical protein